MLKHMFEVHIQLLPFALFYRIDFLNCVSRCEKVKTNRRELEKVGCVIWIYSVYEEG